MVVCLFRLLRSAALAMLFSWGFVAAVGASLDPTLVLLYFGVMIGIHALSGYVRYHRRQLELMQMRLFLTPNTNGFTRAEVFVVHWYAPTISPPAAASR